MDPSTITRPMPLGIGLYGYAGRGKSWSAAALAEGMQRVYGGEVYYADTDGSRGLALRDRFRFRYIDFPPPHNALDFADLLRQYANRKGVLVIDQMTEEHEGEDGLLDTHEKRKGGDEKKTAVAWALAKSQHKILARELRRALITIPVIVCWRAQDKIDWNNRNDRTGKTEPKDLGEMPIGSRDLPFEMTATYLLPTAGERGVPLLRPQEPGEILMTKIPEQFLDIVRPGERFTPAHGEAFARWAMASADPVTTMRTKLAAVQTPEELAAAGEELGRLFPRGSRERGKLAADWKAAEARAGSRPVTTPPRPPSAPSMPELPPDPEDFDRAV